MSDNSKNTFDSIEDVMNMSDEDIMNISAPVWSETEQDSIEEVENTDVELDNSESFEEDDDDFEEEYSEEEYEENEQEYSEEEDYEEDVETEEDVFEDDTEEDTEVESEEETEEDEEDEEVESSDNDTDYKTLYEELMAPFKANKKEIKVDSPEELRRLAQMGVGYNAKMAEIKPLRKIGKMLENAGLLDESKINYVIDLMNKDHGAINKLIQDSGIDPLDLDTEGTEYEPNTYSVNDTQLDLSDTLSALGETDSGVRVITEVDEKWDNSSKQVLLNNPSMLNTLEQHVIDGTYDKIMSIVEKERTLGNVPQGVTDLQAYIHVGRYLEAEKQKAKTAEEAKPKPKKKPKVIKKSKTDAKRNKLRQAAATSRSKSTKKPNLNDVNFANMSDAEFEKRFLK